MATHCLRCKFYQPNFCLNTAKAVKCRLTREAFFAVRQIIDWISLRRQRQVESLCFSLCSMVLGRLVQTSNDSLGQIFSLLGVFRVADRRISVARDRCRHGVGRQLTLVCREQLQVLAYLMRFTWVACSPWCKAQV